jgi:23S rRNA (uracil1939-C5)-methyltransferase
LRLKTHLVEQLVTAALRTSHPVVHPIATATPVGDPWRFRQRASFVFGSDRGLLTVGHYARGSRHVIPITVCPVHDARANDVALQLSTALKRAGAKAASSTRPGNGVLRHLAIRVSAAFSEIMATLVVSRDHDGRVRAALTRARDGLGISSLHVNTHPRDDAFIFGERTRRVAGRDRIREQIAGTTFLSSPTAFFQTNVGAAAIMVDLVLRMIRPDLPVIDLYAGAGLFSLPLAARGQRVLAIEESRTATADGEASARFNHIPSDRCRFQTGRVETRLRHVSPTEGRAVILDPPRLGCDKRVIDEVFGRIRPVGAVYVSCNPLALARDAAWIEAHGYSVVALYPIDMFPHTAHIETVVELRRADRAEEPTVTAGATRRPAKSVAGSSGRRTPNAGPIRRK